MTATASARVQVDVSHHQYDIQIEPGLLRQAGSLIAPMLAMPRLLIISDEKVWRHYGQALCHALDAANIQPRIFLVPPGEASKSLAVFSQLCEDILASGIERKDCVLAFGGGVVGDLAGFVAASLLRGIGLIQWPTTLLSQVDSSVGGKTGINAPSGKNLIGAFYQPKAVFIDTDMLATLSAREWRAGYAEVTKYGLLGDAAFFGWLEAKGPAPDDGVERLDALVRAIATSCQQKAQIVNQDEKEAGIRAHLNLGHTFAHALEAAYGYDGRLIHGEAVSVGMGLAFDLAQALGLVPGQDVTRVKRMLSRAGLPVERQALSAMPLDVDQLVATMAKDKKASGGNLVFIVPTAIGACQVRRDVPSDIVRAVLTKWLNNKPEKNKPEDAMGANG